MKYFYIAICIFCAKHQIKFDKNIHFLTSIIKVIIKVTFQTSIIKVNFFTIVNQLTFFYIFSNKNIRI